MFAHSKWFKALALPLHCLKPSKSAVRCSALRSQDWARVYCVKRSNKGRLELSSGPDAIRRAESFSRILVGRDERTQSRWRRHERVSQDRKVTQPESKSKCFGKETRLS